MCVCVCIYMSRQVIHKRCPPTGKGGSCAEKKRTVRPHKLTSSPLKLTCSGCRHLQLGAVCVKQQRRALPAPHPNDVHLHEIQS